MERPSDGSRGPSQFHGVGNGHMNLTVGHRCPNQIVASLMIGFVVASDQK
jgi:hypothetical protein